MRDVVDGGVVRRPSGVRTVHRPVEHLGQHQGLGGALLEAAHVDQAGGDDLAAVDVGDPGHRHEDPAPAEHLDDQAEHARPAPAGAERDHDVADPADLVAERVEDAQAGQAADEDAGRGAHAGTGYPAGADRGVAARAGCRAGAGAAAASARAASRVVVAAVGRHRCGARSRRCSRRGPRRARRGASARGPCTTAAQRSTTSPTALSRSARSASTAASHPASSGVTSRALARTVSSRPPVSLLRRIELDLVGQPGQLLLARPRDDVGRCRRPRRASRPGAVARARRPRAGPTCWRPRGQAGHVDERCGALAGGLGRSVPDGAAAGPASVGGVVPHAADSARGLVAAGSVTP